MGIEISSPGVQRFGFYPGRSYGTEAKIKLRRNATQYVLQ
jgi:hypothetical protein